MSIFKKATKTQSRARVALVGPAGSGKTYTALTIASGLGKRIAVLDTERGSAAKYAGRFDFDVVELDSYDPDAGRKIIEAASGEGYDVLIVDSLSHFWMGEGGALQLVDQAAARGNKGNSFSAWKEVTPLHNRLVDSILKAKCHVIATMRSKTEYVIEEDSRGKKVPRKIGTSPVMRDGVEYEFDVVADLNLEDNAMLIGKTRCSELRERNRGVWPRGEGVADVLTRWLSDGAAPAPAPAATPARDTLADEAMALEARMRAVQTPEELAAAATAAKVAGLVGADRQRVMAAYREAAERVKLVSGLKQSVEAAE